MSAALRLALILSIAGHTAADQMNTSKANARAFLSLSKRQRELAKEYRAWATEAAQRGRTDHQQHWAKEARRLAGEAAWHLSKAVENTHV